MTTTVGIRDFARSANILQEYDYVHIEDKKTREYKGIFVSPKYAKEFESFLLEKLNRQKQEKLKRLKSFAGRNEIDDVYDNLAASEIKNRIASERFGG